MSYFFNKSVIINNPLRIFFLCGSNFYKNPIKVNINGNEYDIEDKRKVLQNYLEKEFKEKNFRSIILEENFLFSDNSRRHLNYNHINLKSLKSIELLTGLYSDYVFIVHESYSTAAEIGMFSSTDLINNKLMILTPNVFSIEEDYISGFMKLAYNNEFFRSHNINTLYYNPGVYNFHVSEQVRKLHTFFVDNQIKGNLAEKISENLKIMTEREVLFNKSLGVYKKPKNLYQITDKKINVILDSNDLLAYLISLFNMNTFRQEFIGEVDMSYLKYDNQANRRKSLFSEGTKKVEMYFKRAIYNTIKIDIPNIEKQYGSYKNVDSFIDFSINYEVVPFKECISYYLYILYALSYINFTNNNTRFSISNSFSPIYKEYEDLIQEDKQTKRMWSR